MRELCSEAAQHGDVPQPALEKFKKVVVLLNPTADRRSSTQNVILNRKHVDYASDNNFMF